MAYGTLHGPQSDTGNYLGPFSSPGTCRLGLRSFSRMSRCHPSQTNLEPEKGPLEDYGPRKRGLLLYGNSMLVWARVIVPKGPKYLYGAKYSF